MRRGGNEGIDGEVGRPVDARSSSPPTTCSEFAFARGKVLISYLAVGERRGSKRS